MPIVDNDSWSLFMSHIREREARLTSTIQGWTWASGFGCSKQNSNKQEKSTIEGDFPFPKHHVLYIYLYYIYNLFPSELEVSKYASWSSLSHDSSLKDLRYLGIQLSIYVNHKNLSLCNGFNGYSVLSTLNYWVQINKWRIWMWSCSKYE